MWKSIKDASYFRLEMFLTRVHAGQHIYTCQMSKDAIDDLMEKGEKSECVVLAI